MRSLWLLPFVLVLGCLSSPARCDDSASAARAEFFETTVRPLLAERCWKCHGAAKSQGGLRLDSRAAALRGGDSGAALVPGRPGSSLLIEAVRYESFEMPPDGKLPEEAVRALEKWIADGAFWPARPTAGQGETDAIESEGAHLWQAARSHWAFQPIQRPQVPVDEEDDWSRNEIDRFVWRRLREHGLYPSPRADRRTLLRRAFFDLVGMPPTVEEAKQFLSDDSDQAFARLVDRLLADPRYGERWGRYWLDVARYADSKGAIFGEPREYPYAYTYRDYVIAAFNEDKPFDQFVTEQLAADLLTTDPADPSLAALGFLTVHRRSNGGGQVEQWADRVDTVSRGFLALTVACARCHDHKYDPIPMADFYSLMGVFASITEPEELPVIGRPDPESELARSYAAFVAEEDRKRDEFIQTEHQKLLKRFRRQIGQYLLLAHEGRDLPAAKFRVLAGRQKLNAHIALRWRKYLAESADPAVFGLWQKLVAFPRDEFATRARRLIRQWTEEKPASATTIAVGSTGKASATTGSQIEAAAIHPLIREAFRGSPPRSLEEAAARYQQVFDRVDQRCAEHPHDAPNPQEEAIYQIMYGPNAPGVVPAGDFKQLDRLAYLKLLKVEAARKLRLSLHPGAPRRAMVVREADKPYQPHIFIRGDPKRLGPLVPRRFLELLSGPERRSFEQGSGRRELAAAIVSPDNPLTARVMVHRVWLHHFGQGLVDTPDDFGLRSDPPSHPELLDWLARHFIDRGWSIKDLHRQIMTSATYQQASCGDPERLAVDPGNRWLWRYQPRRLDYEAIRDSMLAVSGQLDATRGGPAVSLQPPPKKPPKGLQNSNPWQFVPNRRTVYAVVRRDELLPVMRTFDFPAPDETIGKRHITTVPTQGLYYLNSDFVMDQATALAEIILAQVRDSGNAGEAERVRMLFQRCFQRDPSGEELSACLEFVAQQVSPRNGSSERERVQKKEKGKAEEVNTSSFGPWERLAQVLLMSNEFNFVE